MAKILTVDVPFCSWVHHLGMLSSGVTMLLIFNAVLPPRFLVCNFQNRVTCTNKPSSHTVSFLVWMLPCRLISCPKTLKNEQTWLCASEICYPNTLFLQFGSGRNPLTKMRNYNPSCSRELKRQKFLPYEWVDQNCQRRLFSLACGSSTITHEASMYSVQPWKFPPIATVTISQLYFKIGLSIRALKYIMFSIPERTKRSTLSKFIFKLMCLLSAVANRLSVPVVPLLEPINANRWIVGFIPHRLLLFFLSLSKLHWL